MTDRKELLTAKPEEVGIDSERLKAVGETMQRYIDSGKDPNIVTMIARKGKIVHFEARGYMDIETKKPVSTDTIFRLYSNSKPVTGVAVMILCEEGLLHLDDPVSKFIPAFKDQLVVGPPSAREQSVGPNSLPPLLPVKQEMTVRDCLRNTTGLATPLTIPYAVGRYYEKEANASGWDLTGDLSKTPHISYADEVNAHARIPLANEPGTVYDYHIGYPVVGVVIETVTGKTLEEFYRERIFEPLGMTDTSFYLDEKDFDRFPTCYIPSQEGGSWHLAVYDRPETSEKVKGPKIHFAPGGDIGGLLSTAGDYMRFALMLLNKGELDGVRILSRKSIEIMSSSHTHGIDTAKLKPGFGFGMGVGIYEGNGLGPVMRSPGTYGWEGAAGTTFFVDPKEELTALCFNQVFSHKSMPGNDYQEEFERVVYQCLK